MFKFLFTSASLFLLLASVSSPLLSVNDELEFSTLTATLQYFNAQNDDDASETSSNLSSRKSSSEDLNSSDEEDYHEADYQITRRGARSVLTGDEINQIRRALLRILLDEVSRNIVRHIGSLAVNSEHFAPRRTGWRETVRSSISNVSGFFSNLGSTVSGFLNRSSRHPDAA